MRFLASKHRVKMRAPTKYGLTFASPVAASNLAVTPFIIVWKNAKFKVVRNPSDQNSCPNFVILPPSGTTVDKYLDAVFYRMYPLLYHKFGNMVNFRYIFTPIFLHHFFPKNLFLNLKIWCKKSKLFGVKKSKNFGVKNQKFWCKKK